MLSRRGLIRSAAGLLVVAGAGELLLPEEPKIWALDRSMLLLPPAKITRELGWLIHRGQIEEAYRYYYEYADGERISIPDYCWSDETRRRVESSFPLPSGAIDTAFGRRWAL